MADIERVPAQTVIGGRHGSPVITIALPFSKITTDDSELRAAVTDVALLIARLASAPEPRERESIGTAARELADRVASA